MTETTKPRSTMLLMLELTRYRRPLFVLNFVLWGAFHALPVLFGLFLKGLFDALAGGVASSATAWTFLAYLIAADVGRLGILIGGEWNFIRLWLELELLLKRNLLNYLLTAPGSRRIPDSPSEAISRFRDDVEDVNRLVENWVDAFGFVLYAAVAFVVMVQIDPLMTLLICAPLALSLGLTQVLRPRIRQVRRDFRITTGRVTDYIGEMFNAVQAVKVAGREASVLQHFEGLNARRRRAALRDSLLTEVFKSVTDNMVSIAVGIILLLAAQRMGSGADTFSVGDFALFVTFMPRLTSTVTFLGAMFVQHKRVGVSFERFAKLLQDAPDNTVVEAVDLHLQGDMPTFISNVQQAEPLDTLELKGLSFTYPDGEQHIENVSLTVKRGAFTVITGRIGSGKSTLVRVLLGLLPKDSGEIYWNGKRVADPASFFVPPRSAYTSQVPRLFSDTLRENVVLGKDEARLQRAIKLAVLEPDLRSLERGLDTPVGTRGVKLSGGQVQRSAAARMFMQDAELLVFDDLSSALDVKTEQTLWDGLFARGQATCLVVSHRQAALERADHILVMKNGHVEAEGTLEALLKTSKEMQHLWREG